MGPSKKLLKQEQWDGSTMPTQAGKVAVVTGANSGIGFFTARRLAERGAHVILACRNEAKARHAEQEMIEYIKANVQDGAGTIEIMPVDMGDLASVRRLSEALHAKYDRIDLLINNAGVAIPPQKLTSDGFEVHFGINHLGHFYLTTLLFDLLKAASAARIVHVGSLSHGWVSTLKVTDLARGTRGRMRRYGKSKLSQMLFMVELQRRLQSANVANVVSVAAHPGVTYTAMNDKIVETIYPKWLQSINKKIGALLPLQRADMGALPTLYAATHEHVQAGEYIGPSGRGRRSGYPSHDTLAKAAHSVETAKALWRLSEELTKTPFTVTPYEKD